LKLAARVGVFGGSFDPIHNGHLFAASSALELLELDQILFVPAGNQWQKQHSTSAEDRLNMVKLAIEGFPAFKVSDIDVRRKGATYTIDTMRELRVSNPDSEFWFILGTDAAAGLGSWKDVDELLGLAQFVVVTRPGSELDLPAIAAGRVSVLEIEALDLSSTDFRARFSNGGAVDNLVPTKVLNYIQDHNLYREAK
jgi:nicotinate-nucleotide adenylyltransferase